jgi:hypothetical protein
VERRGEKGRLLSYPAASLLFGFIRRLLRSWQSNNCGDESVKIGATKAGRDINACVVSFSFLCPTNLPARNWRRSWCYKYSVLTFGTLIRSKSESQVTGAVFLLQLPYTSWQSALLMFFAFETRKPFVSDLSRRPQLRQHSSGLLYRLFCVES